MTRVDSVKASSLEEIGSRIRGIIGEQLGTGIDQAVMDQQADDLGKLGISSLDMIKILVAIQSEFKIKFDFDKLTADTIKSMKKMTSHVYELTS